MAIQQKNYDPALMAGAANTVALPQTITDATNGSLAVGANGATNPAFNIDDSASNAATGLNIAATATGTPLALTVIGSGTNEGMTISPKAAANIRIDGFLQKMVTGSGATVTLTKDQSGSKILMDRAAGITFTLPANTPGMTFNFFATVTCTGNYKIITAAGTELLIGGVFSDDTDSSDALAYFPSVAATSNIAVNMDGITKGGLAGTWLRFHCLSSTRWMVEGVVCGTGSVASPFATS